MPEINIILCVKCTYTNELVSKLFFKWWRLLKWSYYLKCTSKGLVQQIIIMIHPYDGSLCSCIWRNLASVHGLIKEQLPRYFGKLKKQVLVQSTVCFLCKKEGAWNICWCMHLLSPTTCVRNWYSGILGMDWGLGQEGDWLFTEMFCLSIFLYSMHIILFLKNYL